MTVLFAMRSAVYVRNFESTLRLLADRGHRVVVVVTPHEQLYPQALLDALSAAHPGLSFREPPEARRGALTDAGIELRRGLDYLRYLGPEYDGAPKLRRRAQQKAPAYMVTPGMTRLARSAAGRRVAAALLRAGEQAAPVDPAVDALVREVRPDLVLVTPLVEQGSPQSAYVRAGRALGARTGLCVYSWDNLTNKGLIHDDLDVITVWNEAMKAEAVQLHGIAPGRVVVTGAPGYDHWFTWRPSRDRAAFAAAVGLDPARPYILYLCSSQFIAPGKDEVPFVRRWIAGLREASPVLREAGVLIRPHPQNTAAWRDADFGDLGQVAVWPREGGNPVDAGSRADYFDSIHHSAAVAGVNTSAQIESAILGRGVYTVLAPEFQETQGGTLHFRHLQDPEHGVLQVAPDMATHARQLEAALTRPDEATARCERFVARFVRPAGLRTPVTPRLVETLEAVAAGPRAGGAARAWWHAPVQPLLRRAVAVIDDAERRVPQKSRPRLI